MKSIEGLREWAKHYNATGCRDIRMFADAIEAELAERYVALPLDADGEPWYRGSKVIDPKDPDGKVNTVWIAGDNTLITDDHLFIFHANELRHYHPPTVEDVLEQFVARWMDTHHDDLPALKAEYAAKLRLAGEDE